MISYIILQKYIKELYIVSYKNIIKLQNIWYQYIYNKEEFWKILEIMKNFEKF